MRVKQARIRVLSYMYFHIYGHSHTFFPFNGKIGFRENPYSGMLYAVNYASSSKIKEAVRNKLAGLFFKKIYFSIGSLKTLIRCLMNLTFRLSSLLFSYVEAFLYFIKAPTGN